MMDKLNIQKLLRFISIMKLNIHYHKIFLIHSILTQLLALHCHNLEHEDDGMMGSFLVVDTTKNSIQSQLFSNWIIYPNPVIDFITVQTITMESNVEYKIFNDIGEKVISSQKNNTNNIEINVSQLPAGAYLIQLKSSGNQLTKYFVKL